MVLDSAFLVLPRADFADCLSLRQSKLASTSSTMLRAQTLLSWSYWLLCMECVYWGTKYGQCILDFTEDNQNVVAWLEGTAPKTPWATQVIAGPID